MQCPYCHSDQIFVTNSRTTKKNSQTWRRRRCQKCHSLFTTHEIIDLSHLVVVKKSGKREKFTRAKLYSGIYGAAIGFKGRNKEQIIDKITQELESQILALKKKEITSAQIADLVLKKLLVSHAGTFLRFLAFCRNITTKSDIQKELIKYL